MALPAGGNSLYGQDLLEQGGGAPGDLDLFAQFKSWLAGDDSFVGPDDADPSSFAQNMGQWGNFAKGLASVGQLGLGWKQLQLGKDQLRKDNAFRNRNYANQVITTNAQVNDQYFAKRARQGNSAQFQQQYGSLSDYMSARGVGSADQKQRAVG